MFSIIVATIGNRERDMKRSSLKAPTITSFFLPLSNTKIDSTKFDTFRAGIEVRGKSVSVKRLKASH